MKVQLDLDGEVLTWLRSTYPNMNLSTLVDLLLRYYKEATDKTPEQYAKIAIERLKNESIISNKET